ncbi:MAG: epoxyqueuosine reductase QueH, partial [Oscillospiraceae bacterium]
MRNYQKELESLLPSLVGRPRLLLHACCAPCASYVLEYLSRYFEITVFFYNPNIYPQEEFFRRQDEAERLCKLFSVSFRTGDWDNVAFLTCAKGLEDEAEGGNRCTACYGLRLEKTAELARNENFDYFTTTLS